MESSKTIFAESTEGIGLSKIWLSVVESMTSLLLEETKLELLQPK